MNARATTGLMNPSDRIGLRRAVVRCVVMAVAAFACCGGFAASASASTPLSWTLSGPTTVAYSNSDLPSANLLQVGCSAPGTCTAVGVNAPPVDTPTGSAETYMVAAQEVNGTWGPATTIPGVLLPAGIGTTLTLSGIYCSAPGTCIVVGTASTYSQPTVYQSISTYEPFYVTEQGGSWGAMEPIAFPANAFIPTGAFAGGTAEGGTTDLACASADHCVVTGYYSDSESLATSGAPSEDPVPMAAVGSMSGFGSFEQTSLQGSVACVPQSTTCTVLGEASSGGDEELAVQTENAGSWSSVQTITSGDGANGQGTLADGSIACPAAGDCVVGGDYPNTYATMDLFAVQETDGVWGSPQGIGDGYSPDGGFVSGQMACTSVGNCVWGGRSADVDESGQNVYYYWQPIVAEDTDGTWSQFQLSPVPAGAIGPPSSDESSPGVSCAGSRCDIVGFYTTNPGPTYLTQTTQPYAFSATLALPASGTTVACSLLTDGTTNYSCTATVADASGATPPGTPTGTVTLTSTLGTFPNGSTCTLTAASTAGQASCTLEYDPGAGYGTQVTVTGAYSGDSTFGSSQGQTAFVPECDQDPSETDGDWQFDGCFTNPDTTDFDTQSTSSLDGMTVAPVSSADETDYSTGGSGGDSLVPSGSTSLSLNVTSLSGGSQGLVTLTNQLQTLNLSGGPVTIPLASGFKLLGLQLTGNITFKPQSGGTAVGTVSGTLPGVLGGGPATVTVTTTLTGQVTSIVATATSGTLANVFGLSSLKLSYASSTWTVNATAQGAGKTTQTLTGSLAFNAAGQPTAGNLQIGNVVLAGLLNVKTFTVSYSAQTGWAGSASITQGKQAASVSITINPQGVMTSGSITASGVTLWQVFTLTKFSMTYQEKGNTWGLSLAVEGKKGAPAVTAALGVSNGTVTGAELDFKNVSMLGKITIEDLHLKYTHTAAGDDDFSGEAALTLPSTAVSKIEGSFAMVNGSLTMAKLVAHGNVPLYGALTLNKLGGEIDLAPKKVIKGFVGLSAGPKTGKGSLLGLDNGEIDYAFPASSDQSGVYTFSGDLTALGRTLGSGKLIADNGIVRVDLRLGGDGAGFKIGKHFTANGSIAGALHGTKFTIRGRVHFDAVLFGHAYREDGEVVASGDGIAACAAIPTLSKSGDSGVFYSWTDEATSYKGDCPY